MRVMVIVKATERSEAGELPDEQLLADMGKFNEELIQAGIMKAGEGLKPSAAGVRVRFSGAERTVTKGPFANTSDIVAGYWLWEVKSLEEAVAWVKRCPNPMLDDSQLEIRPLYEMSDFSDSDPAGEHAAHEAGLREALTAQEQSIEPYLYFSGRCEEAVAFYKQAIGARVGMMMKFSQSPVPLPEGTLQPGFEDKIMHCDFKVGDLTIMASDGCDDKTVLSGFRLAVRVPTDDAADRIFNALADGGTVDMPLCETFWSSRYGQVTDKFNVGWMVMAATAPQSSQPTGAAAAL